MNIFKRIKNSLHSIKDYVMLARAIGMADEARAKTGQRHYVMPSEDGKLVVMDRSNFRKLKQKRYISRKANVDDLIMECFYFTTYKDGSGVLTDSFRKKKLEMYYGWRDAVRDEKKRIRKAAKDGRKKAGPHGHSDTDE